MLAVPSALVPSDDCRGNTAGPDFFLDPLATVVASAQSKEPPGATISNVELIEQLQVRRLRASPSPSASPSASPSLFLFLSPP